ncbi:MAG: antitoxin VapB family protein [Candidatus Bathyarchaeota archaeon]|nr:antitoxin VapB family protein [Candidatus Termiticorpusculum sp.]
MSGINLLLQNSINGSMFSGKTITVTHEAYNALIRERKNNETLSDIILRLTKSNMSKNVSGIKRVVNPEETPSNVDWWYSNSDLL